MLRNITLKPQTTLCHDDGLYLVIKKKEHMRLDVLYSTESLSLNRCSHGMTSFLTRCEDDSLPPNPQKSAFCMSVGSGPSSTNILCGRKVHRMTESKEVSTSLQGKESLTELCAVCAGERARRLTSHVVSPRFVGLFTKSRNNTYAGPS